MWQIFVFLFACLRIFLASYTNVVSETMKFTVFQSVKTVQNNFYIFGLIIWGNLMDNAVYPKGILMICEGYTSLSLILLVIKVQPQISDELTQDEIINFTLTQEVFAYAFYSGIELITMIQLFNWFSKKHFGLILLIIKLI